MYINELKIGTGISIHVHTDNGDADLSTRVIEPPMKMPRTLSHLLCAEPIYEQGKVVQPNDIRQLYDAYWYNESTHRVIKWSNIMFKLFNKHGFTFYIIKCNTNGNEVNRRSTYRVEVCLPAIAQVGENKKTYECFVHDLSAFGMALTFKEPFEESPIHKHVTAVFTDDERGDKFRLNGFCVRYHEVEHNVYRMGVHIPTPNAMLSRYVNNRQMLLLQKR